jgi:N utilization substance protein A
VREVLVDDDGRQATVIVPDDQLSLAIGREGQNARLAARLTGWRIDIRSETEFAGQSESQNFEEEETGGRCGAILTNGRRCPNAALPGSHFCGLDSHQALARFATASVTIITGLSTEEIAELADQAKSDKDVQEIVMRAEAANAEAAEEAEEELIEDDDEPLEEPVSEAELEGAGEKTAPDEPEHDEATPSEEPAS